MKIVCITTTITKVLGSDVIVIHGVDEYGNVFYRDQQQHEWILA